MLLTIRAMRAVGISLQKGSAEDLRKYSDHAEVAGYAVEDVAALVKSGLILGDGKSLFPRDKTTRAQAAVLLYKVYGGNPAAGRQ